MKFPIMVVAKENYQYLVRGRTYKAIGEYGYTTADKYIIEGYQNSVYHYYKRRFEPARLTGFDEIDELPLG